MEDQKKPSKQKPLVENLDYYMEKGMWVFTEHFHLQRGYCCGSGCRHCPYPLKKVPSDHAKGV